jgi:hypothetical protein
MANRIECRFGALDAIELGTVRAAGHLRDPGAQVVRVAYGGGHAQQLDVARTVDNGLLPHTATRRITQVVHLARGSVLAAQVTYCITRIYCATG